MKVIFWVCLCCLALAGCPKAKQTGGQGRDTVKRLSWETPATEKVSVKALGDAHWTTALASPDGDHLLVAKTDGVELLSERDRAPIWRTAAGEPLPIFGARFLAYSASGKYVAALKDSGEGLKVAILDAMTGALVHLLETDHLPTPAIEHGIQPSSAPTGLVGATGGGFWIMNPYGAHRVRAGSDKVVKEGGVHENTRRAQNGGTLWRPSGKKLVEIGGSARAVNLGCYPQYFSVDERRSRIAARCVGAGQVTHTRLHDLADGKVLHSWEVSAPQLSILSEDHVLAVTAYPDAVGVLSPAGVSWDAGARNFHYMHASPDGAHFVGYGDGFQIIDTEGRVLCDDIKAGAATAVSLVGAGKGFLLGPAPGKVGELAVSTLDVRACKTGEPRALGLGRTTNLRPVWLPQRRAFFFMGLQRGSSGPVVASVDTAEVESLSGGLWSFAANPAGTHLAIVDHGSVNIWDLSGDEPKSIRIVGETLGVGMCDEALVSSEDRGWVVYDLKGKVLRAFGGPQPDKVSCSNGRLFVKRNGKTHIADIDKGVWTTAWDIDPTAFFPEGEGFIANWGPTGWSRINTKKP